MSDNNDKELLRLFRSSENRNYAFNMIVRKYQERLYWHIRKMVLDHDDANDLLQNTFIKAWKGLDNFREDAELFTWLYRIATNETLTFLKQKRNKFLLPIVDVEKELEQTLESDQYFDGNELQKKVQKAILTLPAKQRLIFNMKYFDDMKYEEIAEVLGTSVGALKASFHLATKKIQKYIENN
ncbi:MAG: sigma-70 family RNA polymerase sigma factor [Bacteroidota bacterium]|nr:sigma-70 family RNA polymerase sigma factor [Bacteroidota bacterium]MDP4273949.1 sigma-70 family RNA polymerase sigma factor [Bacteroidota bacterium]